MAELATPDATRDGAHDEFAREAAFASRWLAATLPPAALLGLLAHSGLPLALAGSLALGSLVLRLRAFAPSHPLPNLITALRVALTGALGLASLSGREQALLVLVIFTLDGCDGWLARRLDATSAQGAHFDMEADGYLVMSVCTVLAARVGAWALIGGLLRYGFVIASALWPSRGEAPRSRFGRYAFALALTGYGAALAAAPGWDAAAALAGTLVLLASFGRSFLWTFR